MGGAKWAGIFVADCPLTVPPPEIVSQGNEAILNYFAERDAGEVDHLYEAKLLILGEGGAGKTSLVRRLYQPDRAVARREGEHSWHRDPPPRLRSEERAAGSG
jgi:hypothetical protein